jgi:mono/diheme cytochrome c family protein
VSPEPDNRPADEPKLERSLGRWLVAGTVLGGLLVAAFPVYRAVESDRRDVALAERQAAEVAAGRGLWGANCASCHGEQGEGVDAPALNSEEFLAQATEQQIHHVTQAGIPGTEMAAWWNEFGGSLTDEQIRAIVAYIVSWRETAPSRPDWLNPTTTTTAPTTTTTAPHEEPVPTTAPGPHEVTITVTDGACSPLEIDVPAGQQIVVTFRNEGSAGSSLDVEGLGLHMHASPGDTATATATPLSPGTYPFECLGTGHGQVLGVGELHAE